MATAKRATKRNQYSKGGPISTGSQKKELPAVEAAAKHFCLVCAEKGSKTVAQKYCVQCQNFYCDVCVKLHNIIPTMSEHTIVGPEKAKEIVAGESRKQQSMPTDKCRDHQGKVADMYCSTHDVVRCATCMVLHHQQCKVLHIPDNIGELYRTDELEKIEKDLDKVIKDIKDALAQRKKNIGLIKQLKTKTSQTIANFKKEVIVVLDKLEKDSLEALEALTADKPADKVNLQVSKSLKDLEEVSKKMKKSTETNPAQHYVSFKCANETTLAAKDKCKELVGWTLESITFEPHKSILETIQSLDKLGRVDVVRNKDKNPLPAAKEKQVREPERTGFSGVKKKMSYKIGEDSDENSCDIAGSCVMKDGTILLSDKSLQQLKRLTKRGSSLAMRDHLNLPGAAWSVCAINDEIAAVTLPDLKQVHCVSLGDKMRNAKLMDVRYSCYGLAHHGDTLYVSDNASKIYAYNNSGNALRVLTGADAFGSLFADIRNIAVREDGKEIYVADYENGLIAIDSLNGTLNWKFESEELVKPHGVCVDGAEGVFVCGYESYNVLQVNGKGELIGEILNEEDDIVYPRSVSFHQENARLIVTQWNSDEVKLYDLEKR